mgnify:CR=1 FL=1
MQSLGLVLKMIMSVPEALEPPRQVEAYLIDDQGPSYKKTKARSRIMEILAKDSPKSKRELLYSASASASVIQTLNDIGVLKKVYIDPIQQKSNIINEFNPLELSDAQSEAVANIKSGVAAKQFKVHLLDGVPGSGKTEVYFEIIDQVLRLGKQALVLLPEIALSTQWLNRFKTRFGNDPGVWHSSQKKSERKRVWRMVAEGKIKVVVGARSALFLPYADLGLIVIDEEHDSAFKQEEGVIYNARDMAIVRARLGDFSAILASATPSLETIVNVQNYRYNVLNLPNRHGGAILPNIELVDMTKTPPVSGCWLAPVFIKKIRDAIKRGEQALLFLNRRGYSPLTLCRKCGYRFQCLQCTSWLVEHRSNGQLRCHQCDFSMTYPKICPECDARDSLVPCGPGVERLAEEVGRLIPDARIKMATSDHLVSIESARQLVAEIERREIDIIIGTQIIAKGYHFPLLTLVGVVDADLGLQGGDLRAAERTFQLLYQVSGRSGRGERPGEVILQTYMSTHPVMEALCSGNKEKFIKAEISARKATNMPPFGRLVSLIVSGKDETAVDQTSFSLGRTAPHSDEIQVLGPAPAPFALLRGRHRRRLLLKAKRGFNVQAAVRSWLDRTPYPKNVRVQIDIDPYSFF